MRATPPLCMLRMLALQFAAGAMQSLLPPREDLNPTVRARALTLAITDPMGSTRLGNPVLLPEADVRPCNDANVDRPVLSSAVASRLDAVLHSHVEEIWCGCCEVVQVVQQTVKAARCLC